jgi:hypothetical protein
MTSARFLVRGITLLPISLALAAWAFAQSQDEITLSAAERSAALTAIASAFNEQYVFPESRPRIIEKLRVGESAGRYATNDPAEFAERVTTDLIAASSDKHLFLAVDPAGYAIANDPNDEEAAQAELWQRHAIRNHHGLTEMRVLGGNVRYLRISGFEWVNDSSGFAYDSAMRFLKEGDAAIIDLRGNGGGSHSAVRYLISHFMPPDKLEMTFLEGAKEPAQSRTLEHLPAGRLRGMPLYVLIDLSSASAAEAFAYDVREFELGELVGTRTAGAANNNKLLPIAPYFILSISYGRPVHPVTQSNWEGVGVEPTIDAPSVKALDVAHALALQRLGARGDATPEQRAEYAWAKVAADARLNPVKVPLTHLQRLAGSYGHHKAEFRDGELWLHRPNREAARLTPLDGNGLFALERVETLRVRLTGKTMELSRLGEPKPRVYSRD